MEYDPEIYAMPSDEDVKKTAKLIFDLLHMNGITIGIAVNSLTSVLGIMFAKYGVDQPSVLKLFEQVQECAAKMDQLKESPHGM